MQPASQSEPYMRCVVQDAMHVPAFDLSNNVMNNPPMVCGALLHGGTCISVVQFGVTVCGDCTMAEKHVLPGQTWCFFFIYTDFGGK